MRPNWGARARFPLPVIHRKFGRAPPLTAVASCAARTNLPHNRPILPAVRAPKTADGRHGDTVDENQRDLRSADVALTLVDSPVIFHVRFSTVILRAPPLLPRRQRVIQYMFDVCTA